MLIGASSSSIVPTKFAEATPVFGTALKSWIVVHESSLHAMSDENGAFSIPDIPAGSYTVKAWHEDLGVQEAKVTIQPDKEASTEFNFEAH